MYAQMYALQKNIFPPIYRHQRGISSKMYAQKPSCAYIFFIIIIETFIKILTFICTIQKIFVPLPRQTQKYTTMSYMQMAQLDVLNLLKGISTEGDYIDFRNMLARYFADKAQKQIDALWDNGTINEQTIEAWGNERMRTPYRYAIHRA